MKSIELTDAQKYEAIINRDKLFDGIFFTAVKTTGIFCRPSCTARKPKKENIEFFSTMQECLASGYRPCKICRPLENPGATPENIRDLLRDLEADPSRKFKDYDLVKRGLEPNTVRRWFIRHHGLTFQAYQRMYRINQAFHRLQHGEAVTGTAFGSGFESLSGFGESFKNIFGMSPNQSKDTKAIALRRFETPVGTMIALAVNEGICMLEFGDRKMLETTLKMIAKALNGTIIQGGHPHFDLLEKELNAYFKGQLTSFTVPLHPVGTAFQKSVWEVLETIPYGKTRSYLQQAQMLNIPNGVRAVANANGMNKISILIPCHRVIGRNGQLTGYGGGLWRKKFLLDLERQNTGTEQLTLGLK